MNAPCYVIELDILKTSSQVIIPIKRLESGRKLKVILTERRKPYKIEGGCYAVFAGRKPDGNPLLNDCAIEDNTIVYDITDQTVAVAGNVICEIKLYDKANKLITSPSFVLQVDSPVYCDGDPVESAAEYLAFGKIVDAKLEDLLKDLDPGGGIDVTGAAVGQTIVVKSVDEKGVPAAWEAANLPDDGHINSLIDSKLEGIGPTNLTLLQSVDIAGVAEVVATSETPLRTVVVLVKGAKNVTGGSNIGVDFNGKATPISFSLGKDGTGVKYGYAIFRYNGVMWECYKSPEATNDTSTVVGNAMMPYYCTALFSETVTHIRCRIGSSAADYLPTGGTVEIYGG